MSVSCLGLDLGETMGFSRGRNYQRNEFGVWKFRKKDADLPGQIFLRFEDKLVDAIEAFGITHIGYEEVQFSRQLYAYRKYSGFLSILQKIAYCKEIELLPVNVATLKVHALGKGIKIPKGKKKIFMSDAAMDRWHDVFFKYYDEADALWVWSWMMGQLGEDDLPHPSAEDKKQKRREKWQTQYGIPNRI